MNDNDIHESYSCSIGLSLPLYLMPLLNLLLFYPPFLLPLHISPVKHVGLGNLDHTKMLRQEMIMIVGICVLCTRKGPLTRDGWCRDSKDVPCHHPEHWVCGAFTLHNQSLRESKMIELSLPSKTQACWSHPIQVDCWGSTLALQKDCWLEPHVHVELDLLQGGATPQKLLQVFSRLMVQIWTWGFPAWLISSDGIDLVVWGKESIENVRNY